jgi:hypothetical protein
VEVEAYLAGQRAGTHSTKVRSEVSGSGKKPFKQKGTGRARQGGSRPPIHRHGGTSHGPKPRSYAQDLSVGEKKNALKAVLSRRVAEERIVVVEVELEATDADLKAASALGSRRALFVDSATTTPCLAEREGLSRRFVMINTTTCSPTGRSFSPSAFRGSSRTWEASDVAAGTDPQAADHREGTRPRKAPRSASRWPNGQQDRSGRAIEKLFGVKVITCGRQPGEREAPGRPSPAQGLEEGLRWLAPDQTIGFRG